MPPDACNYFFFFFSAPAEAGFAGLLRASSAGISLPSLSNIVNVEGAFGYVKERACGRTGERMLVLARKVT
jgi:hypothetical protein